MKENLFSNIHRALEDATSKKGDEQYVSSLRSLAHQVIYYLLDVETLHDSDRELIYKLIHVLEENGRKLGVKTSYSMTHVHNTCDYKIARELVMKFKGNRYKELCHFINRYHYDALLVEAALDEMIKQNALDGLSRAVQATIWETHGSAEVRKRTYWRALRNQPEHTLAVLEEIAFRSDMDFEIRKEAAWVILTKDLLAGHPREKYFEYYIEHCILPAFSYKECKELSEKREIKKALVALDTKRSIV